MVSIMVKSPCEEPPVVAAAAPPSTATTEYVALLTNGSTNIAFRGTNGREEVRKNKENKANSDEFEMLSRIMMIKDRRLT